jgi:hypothetical protein
MKFYREVLGMKVISNLFYFVVIFEI